jgi:hypothetical protein
MTIWLVGCVVIEGATGVRVTLRVAELLETLPTVLLTKTANCAPSSELVVAGVV